jgi:ADP-ribosylglycohydrolase
VTDLQNLDNRITGCLLAGAVGDALGAGIEFLTIGQIRSAHGPDGVAGYVTAYGRTGAITDDTQMTMFTLEGLIRQSVRERQRGGGGARPPLVVRHAYLRWLHTQGYAWPPPGPPDIDDGAPDGWLADVEGLYRVRAPGSTCTMALDSGVLGTVDEPINNSKGCGGVMRAAPAGFLGIPGRDRFHLGCEVAALTHGHPSGFLTAGFLACTVGALVDGASLDDALAESEAILRLWDHHEETLAAVAAGRLAGSRGLPTPEEMDDLGAGWVAEEALGMAITCASAPADFRAAMLAAVNHSGDSDSVGSITGNLLGAQHGVGVIPDQWRADLELGDEIELLGHDAAQEFRGDLLDEGDATDEWSQRYPGW